MSVITSACRSVSSPRPNAASARGADANPRPVSLTRRASEALNRSSSRNRRRASSFATGPPPGPAEDTARPSSSATTRARTAPTCPTSRCNRPNHARNTGSGTPSKPPEVNPARTVSTRT